jgi:hypothetical protein
MLPASTKLRAHLRNELDPMSASFKKEELPHHATYSTPITWKSLMTGFDTPIMLDGPKRKRTSRWFVGLTCLVSAAFIFTTTQLAPTHPPSFSQLQGFVARSSLFDRTPEASSASSQLNIRARTTDVQFDNYSLILKGQRIFLQYVLHRIFSFTNFVDLKCIALESFTHSGCPFLICGPTFSKRSKLQE